MNIHRSLSQLTLSCLFLITLMLSSCQSEKEVAEPKVKDKSAIRLELNMNLGELTDGAEQTARILLSDRPATATRPKGVNFGWAPGETISDVYVRFRQGAQRAVATGTLKILEHKAQDQSYKVLLDVTPPANIDMQQQGTSFRGGDVYISAAFGVDALDASGQATVKTQRLYVEGEQGPNPPMYAAEDRVTVQPTQTGEILYSGPKEFRLFGSLLRLEINNQSNMSYQPIKVSINEGMLDGSALFDVTTGERQAGYPAGAVKGINVSFGMRSVPSQQRQTFYLWAYVQPRQGSADAFLYNTYSWPEPDVKRRLRFSAIPENHKVYNLPLSPSPESGDLIFTEVLLNGEAGINRWAVVTFELYNPTDHPIDLRAYSLQKQSEDGTGTQTNGLTSSVARSIKYYGDDSPMLPPRKSILIFGNAQNLGPNFNSDLFNAVKRPGIHYASRAERGAYLAGNYNAFQTIRVNRRYNTSWRIIKNGRVVDEIFGGMGIPSRVTIMRKPGRDLPRENMQMGVDTDWVTRQEKNQYDWGFRFGYFYDPARAGGVYNSTRWLLDTTNETAPGRYTDNSQVGFLNRAPLLLRRNYQWGDDFGDNGPTGPFYIPPTWWTRERAEAADR